MKLNILVVALTILLTLELSEAGFKKDKQSKDSYNNEKYSKEQKYNKQEKYSRDEKNYNDERRKKDKYNKYNQQAQEEQIVDPVNQEQLKLATEELRRQSEELSRQYQELKKQKQKLKGLVQVQLVHGGEVQGITLRSLKGRRFFAFRGIPYAEPPVGDLRFKPPVPKLPWAVGTPLDATKDGQVCPQINFVTKTFEGQEDCLLLNVYTGELPEAEDEDDDEESLPVLVWIHGGGFLMGSSHSSFYGPKFLMDQRVVLVTVNYRIGAFGFLSTADAASPGNYGLLDQSLALQWVKENIAEFGGDPGRVTIFGQSAGGVSVGYHLLSPVSSRLFHGAIVMSGSPLCLWAFGKPHQVVHWANKLAIAVGCSTATNDEMVMCLRGIPMQTIVETTHSLSKYGLLPMIFNPTVDGHFLLDEPLTILSSSKIPNRVPVIHGITSKEGLTMVPTTIHGYPNVVLTDKTTVTDIIDFAIDNTGNEIEATNHVYETYFSSVDKNDEGVARNLLEDIFSHGMMDICHYQTVQLLTKAAVPTYVYMYNYQSQGLDILGTLYNVDKSKGVGHAAELGALFNIELPGLPPTTVVPCDADIISNVTTLFTNFAARGNPTPITRRKKFPIEWLQTEESPIMIFNIDSQPSISTYDPSTDSIYDLWTRQVPELIQHKRLKEQKDIKDEL